MKKYAARHRADGHTLLLVVPGWGRTETGGSNAMPSVEESIPQVVDAVGANRGRSGLRYIDSFGKPLP